MPPKTGQYGLHKSGLGSHITSGLSGFLNGGQGSQHRVVSVTSVKVALSASQKVALGASKKVAKKLLQGG